MQDDRVAPTLPRGTTAQRFCPKHLMCAADDYSACCFVVSRPFQRFQQSVYQRHAQRVDRCAVKRDLPNRIRDGIVNEFSTHGAWSPVGLAWRTEVRTTPVLTKLSIASRSKPA